MIVDREWTDRDNRRLARRLKEARLAVDASLEDAVCDAGRGLDKAAVRQLATCAWVRAKQNVIVVGATGLGKDIPRRRPRAGRMRPGLPRALRTRSAIGTRTLRCCADGTYRAELQRLARFDVLVLDDLLIGPLKDAERRDLLEVLEDRYDRCSTVITSQLPAKSWHEAFGIRRSPTRSATASCTTLTSWRCADRRCARRREFSSEANSTST